MEGFFLFDSEHRTSRPLNLAYKAAQPAAPDKADEFLVNLRHATVLDCRPTTHLEEILRVVKSMGLDEAAFLKHFNDGSAEAALEADLALSRRLGIRSLPAFLIQHKEKALLMQSLDYADYTRAIQSLIRA